MNELKYCKKFILVLSIFMLSIGTSFAQQGGTINGKIETSDGKAAEGVSVSIKGTNKNTIARNNGFFELKNVPAGTNARVTVTYKF
ncbi:hypothetical protein [Flavobacterium sp. FlaQc-50]|uniref:hypothetical protein n=1 Tax=unclassified Flavobacterium TaxID=196869 RepID=UPI0037576194